jgi:Holliday junction resolvase RusA-like endonuclease
MPFSYAASKNRIYTMRAGGHVAMRRSATEYKDAITLLIQSKLRDIKIRQNKLWVDIFVQKDNHKGDAVNVVDLVCDAVKVAVGLDDRWFSLRRVDWEIVKHDPRLFIGIGQEAVDDVQACSCCGRLLPFPAFNKKASTKIGVERVCRECRIATDPKKFLNGAAL